MSYRWERQEEKYITSTIKYHKSSEKKGSNRLAAGDLQIYGILCQDCAAEISIFVKNGKGPWFCVNMPVS